MHTLTTLVESLFSFLLGNVITLAIALKPFSIMVAFVIAWRVLGDLTPALIAWAQEQIKINWWRQY